MVTSNAVASVQAVPKLTVLVPTAPVYVATILGLPVYVIPVLPPSQIVALLPITVISPFPLVPKLIARTPVPLVINLAAGKLRSIMFSVPAVRV